MRKPSLFAVFAASIITIQAADPPTAGPPTKLAGLKSAARITRDVHGISHIRANHDADTFFLQGYVHARDRLFQMDNSRRLASGTLAELLGPRALQSDVTLRTIGLRRAAVRSLEASSPDVQAALRAYAAGVNAWVRAHPLPFEYAALELTGFEPWTPVDSLVIGKLIAFGLSFDLDIDPTVALMAYVEAGAGLGFDGSKLFFDDLRRSAPFDSAATVPDASVFPSPAAPAVARASAGFSPRTAGLRPESIELGRRYLEGVREIPIFERILDRDGRDGSNLWAVAGSLTADGRPLIANDPHLQLGTPSTFYPMGLESTGSGLEVFGSTFPGIPGVVLGYNRHLSWGSTNNAIDVTDTYQEEIVADPEAPIGLSTRYQDTLEPLIPIPETFKTNQPGNGAADDVVVVPPGGGIPPATLIVPRRNLGPIITPVAGPGLALSVQFTGFSATREVEAFLRIDRARSLDEFVAALHYFDFGSQNFVVADDAGTIAYFTSGEMPVREDLQAMTVNGLPPWFIRNGRGGNEWLAVQNPQPQQAVGYEILPFDEMPKIVNPPAGWFVNANNDPAGLTLDNDPLNQLRPGGGLFYLAYAWDRGFRAGRITERLTEALGTGDLKVSFEEMQSIQADVVLRDAEYFAPRLVHAFDRATADGADPTLAALGADAEIAEAIGRLAAWDASTPTGIPEGYDAGDEAGALGPPDGAEIDASIAASIYAAWRSRFIANTIDAAVDPAGLPRPGSQEALAALRQLLDAFDVNEGKGSSGIDFFPVDGVGAAADRRDVVMLLSLRDALDMLAGDAFAPAFDGSTDQTDYRWGKLHRIVFAHPLGGSFSIPPAGGAWPQPLEGLSGIPTDGGYQTVDASSHDARGTTPAGFMFGSGPVRRFVSEPAPGSPRSESIWPGGTSGALLGPYTFQFLPEWLTNESFGLLLGHNELKPWTAEVEKYVPAPKHEGMHDRGPAGEGKRATPGAARPESSRREGQTGQF